LDSKAIKFRIKIYLPALTKVNVIYLPKDESLKAQGPLQYTKALPINASFIHWRIILNGVQKVSAGLVQLFIVFHVVSLVMGDAP
jgi:hypothetical protein